MKKLIASLFLLFGFFCFGYQAEIVYKKIDIHILEDGRVIQHVYEKIKINGFTGMKRAGEWFHTYNPELTEVSILKSVTHNSEGQVISSPDNAILDFSPYSVENAPDFSNIREKIVSHTGLEPECIIEFEYEIKDKVPHRLVLFLDLRDRFFIKKVEVNVVDNVHCPLYLFNVKNNDGSFVAENVLPNHTNSMGTEYYKHTPAIALVIKDPNKYFKDYLNSLKGDNVNLILSTMGIEGLRGKQLVHAVYDFVNNRLNTVEIPDSVVGFKCRDFKEIIKSGYATDFEKNVLMWWLLKENNLSPQFLISSPLLKDGKPLNIGWYGVKVNGDIYSKDFALPFYSLNRGKIYSPSVKADLFVKLEKIKDGFKGRYYFEGENCSDFSILNFSKKDEEILEKKGNMLVKQGRVEGKLEENIIKLSNWIGDLLPFEIARLSYYNLLSIDYPVHIVETYVFNFKSNAKPRFHNKMIKNRAGFAKIEYKVKGNSLVIKRSLNIKKGFYYEKDFGLIRELLLPYTSESYSTVILR